MSRLQSEQAAGREHVLPDATRRNMDTSSFSDKSGMTASEQEDRERALGYLLSQHDASSISIHFRDVTLEANVTMAPRPSMWNSTKTMFRAGVPWMRSPKRKIKLLDRVRGVIKPGRFILLIGEPGSGKSLLMQHLSGRLHLHDGLSQTSGSILYNGVDRKSFCLPRAVGYVSQSDEHMPTLTVRETVRFAASCLNPGSCTKASPSDHNKYSVNRILPGLCGKGCKVTENAGQQCALTEAALTACPMDGCPGHPSDADKNRLDDITDAVLHLVGLHQVKDTLVGDEMVRGISGGEKKRLTIAEALVCPYLALFMDELCTGLDSATAFSLIQSFRDICHAMNRTIMVSLQHPSPEFLDLFDDIVILTGGRMIFEGPVRDAVPFFQGLGLYCPPQVEVGSFLQEITTPLGQMEFASAELLALYMTEAHQRCDEFAARRSEKLLVSVDYMISAWRYSEIGKSIDMDLEQARSKRSNVCPEMPQKRFARKAFVLSVLVFRRHLLLIRQNGLFVASRMVTNVSCGLFLGLFFSTVGLTGDPDPQQILAQGRKTIALFTAVSGVTIFIQFPLIASAFIAKPVLLKQRDQHLFPPLSYVLAQTMEDMLLFMLESLLFSVSLYWLSGLMRRPVNFFMFVVTNWSCMLSSASIFRLVSYMSSNQAVSMTCCNFLILVWIITNGFSILRSSIPAWLVWIYYGLNPMAYTVRALCINELTSSAWGQAGYTILELFSLFTNQIWIWISLAYNIGLMVICMLLSAMALRYLHPCQQYTIVPKEQEGKGLDRILNVKAVVKKVTSYQMIRSLSRKFRHSDRTESSMDKEHASCCHGIEISVEPVTVVCRGLNYYVKHKSRKKHPRTVQVDGDKELEGTVQLLRDIDFFAQSCHLTALMGSSGAGKTTIMDILAGRKTEGVIRGDILINGREMSQGLRSRVVGYVEQVDLHSPWITVQETLYFAARMRLPEAEVDYHRVISIVNDALCKVELQSHAHLIVGEPGGTGLSTQHRKRLSIGVELVGSLPVILMDEPTSGLDARSASAVMRAIRNITNSRRTVIVTIHKPLMEIFEAFDMLILLQLGGHLSYFGPLGDQSSSLVSYLEGLPGVQRLQPGRNPATWMLEVTRASVTATRTTECLDFPQAFRESNAYSLVLSEMDHLLKSLESDCQECESRRDNPLLTQIREVLKLYVLFYWRAVDYNFTRIVMSIVSALFCGFVYLGEGKKIHPGSDGAGLDTIQNVLGGISMILTFACTFNSTGVMPLLSFERAVFYRHRAASLYRPVAFNIAQAVSEIPYVMLQSTVIVSLTYWMMGLVPVAWKFFYFLLLFFLSTIMYIFLGQFLVIALPNQLLALLILGLCQGLWSAGSGFFIPLPQLSTFWTVICQLFPTYWIMYGLGASQLADSQVPMLGYPESISVGEFISTFFGYSYSFIWWCVLIVFAFVACLKVCAILALTYVRYDHR